MNIEVDIFRVFPKIAEANIKIVSNKFLSDYTDNLLQRRLSENPHQLYNISYENLKLDLLNGEITLEKIRMDIDSSFADSLKKNNRYPHTQKMSSYQHNTLLVRTG